MKLMTNPPTSGPATDTQIDAIANGSIAVIDNLDPDRPVRIRQVERAS